MQKINHSPEYKSVHPIFDEFERFYFATSEDSLQTSNSLIPMVFDRSFESLQGIFNKYGKQNYKFEFTDKHYSSLNVSEYDKDNVILAFSGGKDSVATALILMESNYNVYLYHVKGLKSASYPDEWKNAQNIASYLGLPIIIDEIQLEGKLAFPEHPMKNMIIANRMLQWGIENNIGTQIEFGNYTTSILDYTAFYYAGDDCIDMWDAYESIVGEVLNDKSFYVGLDLFNLNDTLEMLAKHSELLPMCQSCLGAHRFREHNRQHVLDKYNVKLMPHRCGLCWKCAVEYIYMSDHDVLEYNEAYYKHCVDILKKANKHENKLEFTNIQDLWNVYFQYDIKQSKWKGIVDYGKRKRIR